MADLSGLRSCGVKIEAGRQAGQRSSESEAMHFDKHYVGLYGEVL